MVLHFNWQCWWWTSLLHRVSSTVRHYALKIKSVKKSQQKIFLYNNEVPKYQSFKFNRKKVPHHQSLNLSQSLSTHCCNEWRTRPVIYCSIRLHYITIHSHIILLHAVQQRGYHIPDPLLYLPIHNSLVSSVGTMSSLSKSTLSGSSSAGVMSFEDGSAFVGCKRNIVV